MRAKSSRWGVFALLVCSFVLILSLTTLLRQASSPASDTADSPARLADSEEAAITRPSVVLPDANRETAVPLTTTAMTPVQAALTVAAANSATATAALQMNDAATELPFDPNAVAEQSRNQIRPDEAGQLRVTRPGHQALFTEGRILFMPQSSPQTSAAAVSEKETKMAKAQVAVNLAVGAVVTPTTPITSAYSLAIELAQITRGTDTLFAGPDASAPEVTGNVVRYQRGAAVVEEQVALDAGIEQRWLLDSDPGGSGDLSLVVTIATTMTLSVGDRGYVFQAYDESGQQLLAAVQYRRAIAIDANGQSRWATLSATEAGSGELHQYQLTMTFPAAWLAEAAYPLVIDPLVSNLIRLELTSPAGYQYEPQLAYNADEDEYLVVWEQYAGGQWDVYGQRLQGDGGLLHENFPLAQDVGVEPLPRVAYGGSAYLVAWNGETALSGQLLAATGVTQTGVITVAGSGAQLNDVAYNSSAGRFLVLWEAYDASTGDDIWGRHVTLSGTLASPVTIAAASASEDQGAVTYNPNTDEYLVVWRQGETDIYGRRLTGSGTVLTETLPIATAGGVQRYPDVAYFPATAQYVVVWEDGRDYATNGYDIYGQRIAANALFNGSNYTLTVQAAAELRPQLDLDEVGDPLLVWVRDNGSSGLDVYGQRLTSGGLPDGAALTLLEADGEQGLPRVGGRRGVGGYMVAWADERYGVDVYGRALRPDGRLSGIMRMHPAPNNQRLPQVAFNADDDEYLVVWQDYRGDDYWDIYGQRVSSSGDLAGNNLVISQLQIDQTSPRLAYGGSVYLVGWVEPQGVRAQRLARTGTLLGSSIFNPAYPAQVTDILYNGTANQFFLLVSYVSGGYRHISGGHVSPAGAVGAPIPIATTAGVDEMNAAAAYNPDANQYLVVWESHQSGTRSLIGRRLTGSGVVTTTDVITIASGQEDAPDVAYLASSGRYLVVWDGTNGPLTGDSDIYGRLVTPGGAVDGSAYLLAGGSTDEQYPRLTLDGSGGALLVWQQYNASQETDDLYARPLDGDGQPVTTGQVVQAAEGDQARPVLASDGTGLFLVAWEDHRGPTWDVYAALFAAGDELQDLLLTSDSPTLLGAATTFTATVSGGGPVTYTWDFGDGGSPAMGVVTTTGVVTTHVYSSPGLYTAVVTATNGVNQLTATTQVAVAQPITFTLGWQAEGDQASASMGYAVAAAGDVNEDGYADVLVGAYLYDDGETNEGIVRLYYGAANGLQWTPAWTAAGGQAEAWFGLAVAAGDVNGDGHVDVIVGARNYDEGYSNNGKVFVYYGDGNGLPTTASWTAVGDQDDAYLGHAVAVADIDGDGDDDLIVGARGYSNGQTAEGRVYAYYGSSNGLSSTPDWTAESDYAYAWFGYAVAAAGDVNGDGFADIIIGSPYDGDGQVTGGKAYVYHGSVTGLEAVAAWTVASDQAGSELGVGTSVRGVGDVDGDGFDDVLVGAQGYDSDAGRVFLYLGTEAGLNALPIWTAAGDQANVNLGWAVGYVGDLNRDTLAELFFAADAYDAGATDAGRIYLYTGQAPAPGDSPYWTADGQQVNGRLGHVLGTAGDVDGNGYDDLLVGEQRYSQGQVYEGRVVVYYTTPVTPLLPVADFTAAPLSGGTPLTVSFSNASSYASEFLWSFGDGATSTLVNPAHIYTRTGSYTVTLTAVNAYGSDVLTQPQYITVTGTAVTADFTATPVSGTVPLTVTFSNLSTGADSYLWDFGDGLTATVSNPVHVYTQTGSYTVTLTAVNAYGSDVQVQSQYITVADMPVTADFAATPISGTVPLTVAFTNLSTGADTYAWHFGDGMTSTDATPTHVYTQSGVYTVTLTATGAGGANTRVRTGYITAIDTAITGLTAVNNSPTQVGSSTQLTATVSSGVNVVYTWDFGDGANGNGATPSHTYAAAGTYTATVTASNGVGQQTASTLVTILPVSSTVTADFTATPVSGTVSLTVTFSNLSTGADSYLWGFGDGITTAIPAPVHTYSQAGVYTVTLTASGAGGADMRIRTSYITVTAGDVPIAGLTVVNDGPTLLGASTTLTATVTGGDNIVYAWGFGDGTNGSGQSTTHQYSAAGTYTATVTASNGVGQQVASTAVAVYQLPTAAFTAAPVTGQVPLSVTFTNDSTHADSYLWQFGDGSTATTTTPQHEYTQPGVYTVSLTASSPFGTDILTRTDYITVTVPTSGTWHLQQQVTGTFNLGVSVDIDGDAWLIGSGWPYQAGSAIILTRDGSGAWIEQGTFTPGPAYATEFGYRVAVSGDVAVVGSPSYDNWASDFGRVYIYERDAQNNWSWVTDFYASNTEWGDRFGASVAIDGNTLVVGAPGHSEGRAYVFMRADDGTWEETDELMGTYGSWSEKFGTSVAIDDDIIVVGAAGHNYDAGAAYVFHHEGTTWVQQTKLEASNGADDDAFGTAVAVDRGRIVVGAPLNGENGLYAGFAYVFEQVSDIWTETTILVPIHAEEDSSFFGYSVAVSGNTIVVGHQYGNYADIFTHNEQEQWIIQAELSPGSFTGFGASVAIQGNRVVVGAPYNNAAYIYLGPNTNPIAAADAAATGSAEPVTIAVLANDEEDDADPLTVTSVVQPANGTAVIYPTNNTITYTPNAGFGGADVFTYTISDGQGGIASASVTVLVNDAPIAQHDMDEVVEDTFVIIPVTTNDTDPNGDALAVTAASPPTQGTATINDSHSVLYDPAFNFTGTDTFTYTIADSYGYTATAVVTVTVTPANDSPVIMADTVTTTEDMPFVIDVLTNDIDVDGDVLTVINLSQPISGTAHLNPDSTITYTPTLDFNGVDTFAYVAGDPSGSQGVAAVTIHVLPGNDAPVAVDDAITTPDDRSPVIAVLANDTDIDGDALTVIITTPPTVGSAAVNPDNTITYTPMLGYTGGDSLGYQIDDGHGSSDTAMVTINTFVPGPIDHLEAVISPTTAYAGDESLILTLTARDANDNVATNYQGSVEFVESAPSTLPDKCGPVSCGPAPDYTFTYADAGQVSFTFAFDAGGTHDVYIYDWDTPARNVTTNPVTVLEVYLTATITPTTAIAQDKTLTLTVEARDENGDIVSTYRGAIEFVESAPSTLPEGRSPITGNPAGAPDYTFTTANAGQASFNFAFIEIGTQTVYISQFDNGNRNTTTNPVTVTVPPPPTPAPPSIPPLSFDAPPTGGAGGGSAGGGGAAGGAGTFGLPAAATDTMPSNKWQGYPEQAVLTNPGTYYLSAGYARQLPGEPWWSTYYACLYFAYEDQLTDARYDGGGTDGGPAANFGDGYNDSSASSFGYAACSWPISFDDSTLGLALSGPIPGNTNGVHLDVHAGGNSAGQFIFAVQPAGDSLGCFAADKAPTIGDPIDTRTGEFYIVEHDFGIETGCGGVDLRFERTYRSMGVSGGVFGFGWTHNYNLEVVILQDGFVAVRRPNGSYLLFQDVGEDVFTTIAAAQYTLMKTPDGGYALVRDDRQVDRFDADGRLIARQDPHGNLIWLTYETASRDGETVTRLARVDDASGRFLWFGYDYYNIRQLNFVADHTGRAVTYTYDDDGFLATATDALGGVTTYTYDADWRLMSKTDPESNVVFTNAYDSGGRVITQTNYLSQSLSLDYQVTTVGITTTVTEEATAAQTVYIYDRDGHLRQVVDAAGAATALAAYDANRRPAAMTDARQFDTQLAYDIYGMPVVITDALSAVTTLSYDAYFNVTQTMNARDAATVYRYDHPLYPRFATSMTDAQGHTTTYTPTVAGVDNPFGGLLKEERDAAGNLTTYTYSDAGQLIVKVAAAGTPQAVTTHYGYDSLGRLITETTTTENHLRRYFYDAGDRLVAEIDNWDGVLDWHDCSFASGPRDRNICTLYAYDAVGRRIATTNALGNTTLTFYDPATRTDLTVRNYDGTPYDPDAPAAALCNFQLPTSDLLHTPREYNLCSLSQYDGYGRVITSTDTLGRQTVTEYDPLGRVRRTVTNWHDGVFDAAEPDRDIETQYAYDALGNTILVTDTVGNMTRTFYDGLGRTTGTIGNWDGSITLADCHTLLPDRDDNVCTQYAYDAVGNTIIVTDTMGRRTRTFYDSLNRAVAVVSNWNPTTLTTPADCVLAADNLHAENVCTLYGYDAAGRQVTTTNALNQTSLIVYDAAGRTAVQVTNWDGQTTILPDGSGCAADPLAVQNICHMTTYDTWGRRAATVDPLGHITEFAYDGLGRVITTTRYLEGEPVTTHTTYDALGSRLAATDANGHTMTYAYDTIGRLRLTTTPAGVTSTQTYNAAGWVLTTTNGLGQATTITYDELGRRLTTTDAAGNSTTTAYDALGNQITVTDAENITTRYDYDGRNHLVAVIENWDGITLSPCHQVPSASDANVCTQYQYDISGSQLHITNALGITNSTTVYDSSGRPLIVRDALGRETETQYDALGHPVVITDANGAVTKHTYDALNRLAQVDYLADGKTVAYAYDVVGNRRVMTDSLGVTTYFYDDLNRVASVTDPFTGTVAYAYDGVGNRIRLTYPDGKVVTYTYNLDNQLAQVTDWETGITTYGYDRGGQLMTTTLPNGVQTVHGYDMAGRLIQLTHTDMSSGGIQADYRYELDNLGNRAVATETMRLPDSSLQTAVITYTYDAIYRLTAADHTGAITASYRYVYDAVGNMTAYTETVGTDTAIVERTFDDANQLVTSSDIETGTTSFYYDANGRLVEILPPGVGSGDWAGALRYGYDQRNLLITSTVYLTSTGWTTQVQYRYDGSDNRVQQIDFTGTAPVTTTYTNDNNGLSTALAASNGITTTYNLVGLDLISQDDGSEVRVLLTDGLGSSRIEMVGSGIASTATYEPFGKLLARTGTQSTVYGYAGEQFDAASGLVYLRARYYNPNLKLFLSRDPFPGWNTLPASQHPYSYSHNNPVNLTDPTGEFAFPLPVISFPPALLVVGGIAITVGIIAWLNRDALVDTGEEISAALQECIDIVEQAFNQPNPEPEPEPEEGPIDIYPPIKPTPDSRPKDILLSLAQVDGKPEIGYFNIYLVKTYPQRRIYDHSFWVDAGLSFTERPFPKKFKEATEVPPYAELIHFNLTGLLGKKFVNYQEVLEFGNIADPASRLGSFTAWELRQIKERGLCSRTLFYESAGGLADYKIVSAPAAVCP